MMTNSERLTVYHIPVCPFSQRLEILLALKGLREEIEFYVVDITKPRPSWLLELTRGSTSLPVLKTEDGKIIKESLVILNYLEARFPEPAVSRKDPYEAAVEGMMCAMEGPFTGAGYRFVMNQDRQKQGKFLEDMLAQYRRLNDFLVEHNPEGTYLFEKFGLAEAVFTPMFMRFWFLEYYEGFELPAGASYDRVRRWQSACLSHRAAQQVSKEEIVKVYYDYARGYGNGALPEGRRRSSFVFEPHWSTRPWPPEDKYGPEVTDAALGLDQSQEGL